MLNGTAVKDLCKVDVDSYKKLLTYFDMQLRQNFIRKRWLKAKTEVFGACLTKYRNCVQKMKRFIRTETVVDTERRKSCAKLHVADRPIRRVASKLKRKPSDELERLRKKGSDWTANDLFRFQYSDPEGGTNEERRRLCYEWLDRLHEINKKYCYLAWYEAAIYACYYRLATSLTDPVEKKAVWHDVRMEYAEIFLMGRRIWRRAIHPSRLRVFYDMAMLCVRFANVENDTTIPMFRDLLDDATNFDFKIQDEVEFAQSIDKISRLENYVIDQFYPRRRSSGSIRSSFRSRRSNADLSPSRRSETAASDFDTAPNSTTPSPQLRRYNTASPKRKSSTVQATSEVVAPNLLEQKFEEMKLAGSSQPRIRANRPKSLMIPTIVINGPSRSSSFKGTPSPRGTTVRFESITETNVPIKKSN